MLRDFKDEKLTYLVVTDIAARGLDIPDLPYVIQYDLPKNEQEYTHRSGRTGRMGKRGIVISFVNQREIRTLKQFLRALGKDGQLVRFFQGRLALPEENKSKRGMAEKKSNQKKGQAKPVSKSSSKKKNR
ncbi:putative ATP-dependent RNA helicase [Listeria floridensis FSL S10-1187]|uniref:ATP-dependent RNA helicase n=1 Tax=Listeria floridensis FSL S10-1187 TaxID=1265817 RepID=A0ABP3AWA8_9LIST|nr:putative ATP-dependent RNA helicase [Listeria floridensis FSL S10-1187]